MKRQNFSDIFDLAHHKTYTFIGSGGKTSLMWRIAQECREARVLVTATTKIEIPKPAMYERFLSSAELLASEGVKGITLAGDCYNTKPPKVGLPDGFSLLGQTTHYDKIVVEGDGSRMLPYKGWAEHEPVIPSCNEITVAILPVPAKPIIAKENLVHRFSLFLSISKASEGKEITPAHLANVIASPQGLLGKATGKILLFFNQVENAWQEEYSEQIVKNIPAACKSHIWRIVKGSAINNEGSIVWENKQKQ